MLGSRVQGVGFTEKRSGPMSGSQKEGPFQGPFCKGAAFFWCSEERAGEKSPTQI